MQDRRKGIDDMETKSADRTIVSHSPAALEGRRTIPTAGLIGDLYVSKDAGGSEISPNPGNPLQAPNPCGSWEADRQMCLWRRQKKWRLERNHWIEGGGHEKTPVGNDPSI